MREAAVALLLALLAMSVAAPAEAHRLKAFASVDGMTINGSAYFSGMGMARGVEVEALAPDGSVLARTTTDDQGRFSVTIRRRVDHRIIVDAGDGHRAEYLVRAEEMPQSIAESLELPADIVAANAAPVPASPPPAAAGGSAVTIISPELEQAVDHAVARHIGPLREQLDAFEDAIRFRDILGGLGWIVGITGVACYFLARRNG